MNSISAISHALLCSPGCHITSLFDTYYISFSLKKQVCYINFDKIVYFTASVLCTLSIYKRLSQTGNSRQKK